MLGYIAEFNDNAAFVSRKESHIKEQKPINLLENKLCGQKSDVSINRESYVRVKHKQVLLIITKLYIV